MPLVLQPIDQEAKVQLARQLACWARMPNGFTDRAVQFGTCCVSPTGQTLGRWTIPDALCAEYGPLPFTGNQGQTITCPPTAAEIMPYYIWDSDVADIDPVTCQTGIEPLEVPTNLAVGTVTATSAEMTWDLVTGADGYTIGFSSDGGQTWSTETATTSPHTLTLTADTTYIVRIRATDSTNVYQPSPWSAPTEPFTTPAA